jgi:hypothetical protein
MATTAVSFPCREAASITEHDSEAKLTFQWLNYFQSFNQSKTQKKG